MKKTKEMKTKEKHFFVEDDLLAEKEIKEKINRGIDYSNPTPVWSGIDDLLRLKKKLRINEVEVSGDAIASFEKVEPISEIILLGANGGIRRITLKKWKI